MAEPVPYPSTGFIKTASLYSEPIEDKVPPHRAQESPTEPAQSTGPPLSLPWYQVEAVVKKLTAAEWKKASADKIKLLPKAVCIRRCCGLQYESEL